MCSTPYKLVAGGVGVELPHVQTILPIFEATFGNPSVEGGLPPLEARPLRPFSRLGALVALPARLPRARAIASPNSLPVPPRPVVWGEVV